MPRFYTIDGAVYDLSAEQSRELQRMWEQTGGAVTAAFAAREFGDQQLSPPHNTTPMNARDDELARMTWNTPVEAAPVEAILDEWAQEYTTNDGNHTGQADPNRPRLDLELAEVARRLTRTVHNGGLTFTTPLDETAVRAVRWYAQQNEEPQQMEKLKPLTYPLTNEVNDDGVKRLFKTRYQELESMYADLHYNTQKLQSREAVHRKMYQDLTDRFQNQTIELNKIKNTFVDGELVSKRLHSICKEVGIPVPSDRLNLQAQIDAFLGSVMSMIRVEGVDELAD
jgi:flagellar motor protein MotB